MSILNSQNKNDNTKNNQSKDDNTKVDLKVGDFAPEFIAKDQNGNEINSKEILKSEMLMLVFYPGDETPGCTTQLCEIRDKWAKFQELGVKVLGVNQGKNDSHTKFISKFQFPFDLIQDDNREISKMFGAISKFFVSEITKRGVFLIDTNGKIIYKHWGMQNNEEIFELLKTKKQTKDQESNNQD